ncbi:unnamed protein product [Mytilus coruscus]|uniref:USP domain-containing protein n=1 Tax=Mytilus coruscus TaxID=42192 RepID=A0A6J8DPU9_MYTCO|nr:unnamed protein product [Mytilus coruscus]
MIKDACCEESEIWRSFRLLHCPSDLIITLARYIYKNNRVEKVRTPIILDPLINLSRYIDSNEDKVYRLKGIVVHHGNSPALGHYTYLNTEGPSQIIINDNIFDISHDNSYVTDSYILRYEEIPMYDCLPAMLHQLIVCLLSSQGLLIAIEKYLNSEMLSVRKRKTIDLLKSIKFTDTCVFHSQQALKILYEGIHSLGQATAYEIETANLLLPKCKDKISNGKYVLVAGDFNTTLSSLDKSEKTLHCNDKAVKTLYNIMQEKGLCDIWRNRNVDIKTFSRKQVVQGFLTQSRNDYFLVSTDLKSCIKNIHNKDTCFSDNDIVSMKIDFCNVERGPGVWIFNNSFLQDEIFTDKMKRLFAEEIWSKFYVSDPLIWWDNFKFMVKKLSQIYGKEKQKDLNREYYKLQSKIQELSVKSANGFQINNEYFLELKAQLENIEKYKCKGVILRSKSTWALESDRNTAYFLKIRKVPTE